MVKNPGETPGVGTIRPLNPPVPTGVVEDEHGRPVAVAIGAVQPPALPHKSTRGRTGVQGTESPPGSGVSPDSSPSRRGVGRALRVTTIEDRWKIDDEWWRTNSVSRMYYRVLLEDGQALTLYRDMMSGRWYRQRY